MRWAANDWIIVPIDDDDDNDKCPGACRLSFACDAVLRPELNRPPAPPIIVLKSITPPATPQTTPTGTEKTQPVKWFLVKISVEVCGFGCPRTYGVHTHTHTSGIECD